MKEFIKKCRLIQRSCDAGWIDTRTALFEILCLVDELEEKSFDWLK